MRAVGIICECNPFHGGHQYLIDRARVSGADAVICVMSGNFVQRGEAAILSPQARAEILAASGADAVFELPFPFSAASAEFFGRAGVEILGRLGVDELWFGSECGDVDTLWRLAEIADSPAFCTTYAARAERENGTADAYFALLSEMAGLDAVCAPNDILGISYLRAIRKLAPHLLPITVCRMGSGYRDADLPAHQFPSATALRRAWKEQGLPALDGYLSPVSVAVAAREQTEGRAPADLKHAEALVLGTLRLTPLSELETYAGLGGGLAGRLKDAASRASSLADFYALCSTKKYPDARIRRGVLAALLRVCEEDLQAPIAYVRLLAANGTGCAFVSSIRRFSGLPVLTRKTDLPTSDAAKRQFEWEQKSAHLYALCAPIFQDPSAQLRRVPLILENKK